MQGERITLVDLCIRVENLMIKLGYKEDSICRYRKVWKKFRNFSKNTYFNDKECADFLVKEYRIYNLNTDCKFTKSQMFILRTIQLLSDYEKFGTFFRKKTNCPEMTWPEEFRAPVEVYVNHLRAIGISAIHTKRNKLEIKSFISYVDKLSIRDMNGIVPEHISTYIASQTGYAPKTIATKISILKLFFKHLYFNGYLSTPLFEALPKVRTLSRTVVPTVWSKEDVEKILAAIDRGNPTGKRDYAIALLVARLGLRIGDVRSLQLSDLKWDKKQIEITQNKTGNPQTLPLLDEIGWSIIDYLKYGRPLSKSQNVFIRHIAPFEAFSDYHSMHRMITTYMTLARIPLEGKRKTGMHSLRHSLATELMQHNVELPVISEILGHTDVETTKHYLKVNLPALRQCALNVEVFANEEHH